MIYLSIIIPHYNSSASLNKLIKTIPNSKEIQIIVVDDHSDWKHKEELAKFKQRHENGNIEFYNNDLKKKGAGACRNIGIERALGKWLLFADSDDFFQDDFFDIVERYLDSGDDVVFFKPTSIESDTGKIAQRHLPYSKLIENQVENQSLESELSLRYKFFVPWSKLIKTNLVRKNKILFEDVIVSNDVMFSTKVGYHMKEFSVCEDIIYCVTRNKGSLTTSVSQEIFNIRFNVFIRYYKFLNNHLNKGDLKKMHINGRSFLLKSSSFGISEICSVFLELNKNNIRIADSKVYNPIWFTKKIISVYYKKRKLKKYLKSADHIAKYNNNRET